MILIERLASRRYDGRFKIPRGTPARRAGLLTTGVVLDQILTCASVPLEEILTYNGFLADGILFRATFLLRLFSQGLVSTTYPSPLQGLKLMERGGGNRGMKAMKMKRISQVLNFSSRVAGKQV